MVYLWSFPSAAKIYKMRVCKGLVARLCRSAPGGGKMIVEFDIIADYFHKNKLF